jgi:hypothetical protein
VSSSLESGWENRRLELLDKAKRMKLATVVDRDELLELQSEIRELERRIDRPVPLGATALRVFPSLQPERTGRVPIPIEHAHQVRICAFGKCDGSGWLLREGEDVADPCACQRLPRDREARRQTRRIIRKGIAPGKDSAFFFEVDGHAQATLREYASDVARYVGEGGGLWTVGSVDLIAQATAFLAAEAMRAEIPVLLYPGDELLGRLRRLAAENGGRIDREIYRRLAEVDLLVIDGLDAASQGIRFPEAVRSDLDEESTPAQETQGGPYLPGMSMQDLEYLDQIFDERLNAAKATILTTSATPALLEDEWLHLPGAWPDHDGAESLSEPKRRKLVVRHLLSRAHGLCGEPVQLAPKKSSVRPISHSEMDANERGRTAA